MESRRDRSREATAGRARSRRSRFAERSLLANPLPVIAAAITGFLVAGALLGVRLMGSNPAVVQSRGGAQALSTAHSGTRTIVRTSASGRRIVETVAVGANGVQRRTVQQAPLRSRASGFGERADD